MTVASRFFSVIKEKTGALTTRHTGVLLLSPLLICYTVAFIAPIVLLFITSFVVGRGYYQPGTSLTAEHYLHVFTDSFYQKVLLNTLAMGVYTTCLTLLLGYPLAYHHARASSKTKGLLTILVISPMFVSLVVRGYAWSIMLSDHGVINNTLMWLGIIDEPIRLLNTMKAVVVGMVNVMLPFMVLPISSAVESINPHIEESAYVLGAGKLYTFFKVTFPLSLPGVIAGTVMTFAITVSSFVMPALLGGPGFQVFGTIIYNRILLISNWPVGAAMAFILVSIVVLVMYFQERLLSVITKRRRLK
ncbi:MAG: ABC transporter permease [Candidatus Methanofastidiosia archaeon]